MSPRSLTKAIGYAHITLSLIGIFMPRSDPLHKLSISPPKYGDGPATLLGMFLNQRRTLFPSEA
jgi:hypothetical protein